MRFPPDTPEWFEILFKGIEDSVGTSIEHAKTGDEAIRATGEYRLFRRILSELNVETAKQEEALKGIKRFVNAR